MTPVDTSVPLTPADLESQQKAQKADGGESFTSSSGSSMLEAAEARELKAIQDAVPSTGAKLSSGGLFFNVVLSIIGTTVLGITSQMRRGGWIFGPLLMAVGCGIAAEMTRLVSISIDFVQARDGRQIQTFQEFAESALGPWGGRVASVASTLSLLGMICNGLVIESQNLQITVPLVGGVTDAVGGGAHAWAVVLTSTSFIYAFVDIGPLLKKSAAIGPFVCALCILLAWVGTGSAVADQKDIPSSCLESDGDPNWTFTFGNKAPDVAILDLASVACYAFFCFAVVVTVPSLKHQMQEPRKLAPVATSAYSLCTTLFVSIMVIGYLGLGNLMPDNIIDVMRQDRPAGWWALTRPWETGSATISGQAFGWMIIVNLLLTDAIYVPCTIVAFETALSGILRPGDRFRGAILRSCICIFRLLVATYVTSFVALTNLTSALFCVLINIIMPIAAFYKLQVQRTRPTIRMLHLLIFVFGWMVMLMGSWKAISDIITTSESVEAKGVFPRPGITSACKEAYWKATKETIIDL